MRAKMRVGPRRDEREAVVGEMRVERRDQRVGVVAREIVDDAGECDVVAADDERHRVGGEPVGVGRVDAERRRADRRERPIGLALDAVVRSERGGEPFRLARRRAGGASRSRERRRASRRRAGVARCEEAGKGEDEMHVRTRGADDRRARCGATGRPIEASTRVR